MLRDPSEFFTAERLDLIIKQRFFQHLLNGDDPYSEVLYRWHIEKRTGGREPGSWKQSVDDYVTACGALLTSMAERGFDHRHPVMVGTNGRLRDGAHRIACASVLGLRIRVDSHRKPGTAPPWDEQRLKDDGINPDDLAWIKRALKKAGRKG